MSQRASFEVCAGGGGQALGLERAGFVPLGLVESSASAVATLRANRPEWPVSLLDVRDFDGSPLAGEVDLLAAGVPCPPFSVAGRRLGAADQRDLFPAVLALAAKVRPAAVLIENVCGLASPRFSGYLADVRDRLEHGLGIETDVRILKAADFGLPQLRPRLVIVGLAPHVMAHFAWPTGSPVHANVGDVLFDLMSAEGWPHASAWRDHASEMGPTIVGGSHLHGGPDLGPARARTAWSRLGVDGRALAKEAPSASEPHFLEGAGVRLTLRMVARLQGFPDDWQFSGSRTERYRQVGNAFPPPVAHAVAGAVRLALEGPAGSASSAPSVGGCTPAVSARRAS